MGSLGVLQSLVFEPKQAFAALAERPRVLFPLLVLLVSALGVLFWYFAVVDLQWLVGQAGLDQASADMTEEQRRAMSRMGPAMVKWSTLIFGAVFVIGIRLAEALFFLLAGKITNVQRSYKHWLSLSAWSSLPGVLGVIPAAVVLLTSTTTQINQGDLQSLSLNNLLFHLGPDEPGYTLLVSINLLQLLCVWLAALGLRAWSGRSWLFCIVFTALPMVLVYGIWGFFSLGRA